MARLLLFISIILFTSFSAFCATLKGKVTDKKGEPLPFATVYIKGSTIGTAANAKAEYQLTLSPGTYSISCQYMGFQQVTHQIVISGEEAVTHDFVLDEQSLQMENVVVKANAEDPAYAIIRKAIEKRKFHQQQVEEFQTSIYMKGVIRNRKMPSEIFGLKLSDEDMSDAGGGGADSNSLGILYLSEQEADYYSDGKNERTVIRSVRESGNPNGFGLSRMPPIVSFYDNNVSPLWGISERGFISPISENALFYYKYKYQGQFLQDGFTIYKIKVIPRRQYEPLFSGAVYIVDDDWAIHSLDLWLTKKSNLTDIDTLQIEQTYLPLKKDTWIIKSQVQYPTLKLFGMDFTANFVAVYDNQKVNEPLPENLFDDKIISSYDKSAKKRDTNYWVESRALPLEDDEKNDYQKRDSLYAKYTSPEYRDTVRRRGNKFTVGKPILGGYSYNSKKYKHHFATNSLLGGMLSYNTVEGIVVSPKFWWDYRIDTGKTINTVVGTRYGISNTHFNTYGRISYTAKDKNWRGRLWTIGVEGGKYVFQYNPRNTVTPLYNTVTTLLYGRNYMKLYERWTGAAFVERKYGNGFSWRVKTGFQKRLPLTNTAFFSFAGTDKEMFIPNVPPTLQGQLWEEHNAALLKVSLSYQPGVTYIQYPDFLSPQQSIWPVFGIEYEKGIPGIFNSKTDFDKWRLSAIDYVNMKLLGSIEYNIAIGGFLNKNYVSLPDMMHVADNRLLIAAPYLNSFQMAPYYQYSNTSDLYGEVHLEYNMNGLLTNKLPLLRRARWNLVTGTNTLLLSNKDYYTEIYVGVDNLGYKIFRFLRVDLVKTWDNYNNSMIGIRIGLDTSVLGLLGGVTIESDNEKFVW